MIIHIAADNRAEDGEVFVLYDIDCVKKVKKSEVTKKDDVARCLYCKRPAVILDCYYPYYSDNNRCEKHKDIDKAIPDERKKLNKVEKLMKEVILFDDAGNRMVVKGVQQGYVYEINDKTLVGLEICKACEQKCTDGIGCMFDKAEKKIIVILD